MLISCYKRARLIFFSETGVLLVLDDERVSQVIARIISRGGYRLTPSPLNDLVSGETPVDEPVPPRGMRHRIPFRRVRKRRSGLGVF